MMACQRMTGQSTQNVMPAQAGIQEEILAQLKGLYHASQDKSDTHTCDLPRAYL